MMPSGRFVVSLRSGLFTTSSTLSIGWKPSGSGSPISNSAMSTATLDCSLPSRASRSAASFAWVFFLLGDKGGVFGSLISLSKLLIYPSSSSSVKDLINSPSGSAKMSSRSSFDKAAFRSFINPSTDKSLEVGGGLDSPRCLLRIA